MKGFFAFIIDALRNIDIYILFFVIISYYHMKQSELGSIDPEA